MTVSCLTGRPTRTNNIRLPLCGRCCLPVASNVKPQSSAHAASHHLYRNRHVSLEASVCFLARYSGCVSRLQDLFGPLGSGRSNSFPSGRLPKNISLSGETGFGSSVIGTGNKTGHFWRSGQCCLTGWPTRTHNYRRRLRRKCCGPVAFNVSPPASSQLRAVRREQTLFVRQRV